MDKIEERLEILETEIESLIVSLDILKEIQEGLDKIGIVIYKLYNKIGEIIDE